MTAIRAEYYNNILCIEGGWLYGEGEVMTFSQYKHFLNRGQLHIARRGCRNTPALVEWESIPERFKVIIAKKHGNPQIKIMENIIEKHIQHDSNASKFFESYLLPGKIHLKPSRQREYYANAIILNALHELTSSARSTQRALGGKVNVWDRLSGAISDLDRGKYPHSLPENSRRLRDRLRVYLQDGYESLIHKNFGNKTAAKVDDDIKESVLIELLADPRNLDNEQVSYMYNMIAGRMKWKTITGSAVSVWRDKYELETRPGRRGLTDFRNTRTMQAKRRKPAFPLYYWTVDGWDAELLYQETKIDRKGNSITTYHNRLTLVVVLDPCINYPIGYAIGTHETPELITEALRNAVNHTVELFGARCRSHQLQSDRYAIKTLSSVYEAVAEYFTPARAHNAKTKVIEPYFKYLNKTRCQLMPNWSGFGVTAKKESQPNSDFLNKYRHSFPDQEGCRAQLEYIMQRERRKKHARYMDLWGKMPVEDQLFFTQEDYLYYFGASTEKNTLEPQGLTPKILGVERFYDCFDMDFRKHRDVRWTVKYDPDDLSTALAVSDDGTLRFMLTEKYVQPMALKERKEGDAEELQAIKDYNKELEGYITDTRSRSSSIIQELFDENPQLNDTLAKMVLVNSQGQHKNERNSPRFLQSAAALNQEAEATEAARSQKNFRDERKNYLENKVDLSKYLTETV